MIAALYKIRWQIELLFKQLKQNFPLKYFLGDNENAIKIQIYCALIANLLMTVVQKRLKRHWSFSDLVSFCKIHLFSCLSYSVQTAVENQMYMSDSEQKRTSVFNKFRQSIRRGTEELEKIILNFINIITIYISRTKLCFDWFFRVMSAPFGEGWGEVNIDISHLANGLYFLKVDGKVFKVIKE